MEWGYAKREMVGMPDEMGGGIFSSHTYAVDMPLRVPIDEVEPCQVNARKRPVSDFPSL